MDNGLLNGCVQKQLNLNDRVPNINDRELNINDHVQKNL